MFLFINILANIKAKFSLDFHKTKNISIIHLSLFQVSMPNTSYWNRGKRISDYNFQIEKRSELKC